MKDFQILIDGEPCLLSEFIAENTAPDVGPLADEEMDAVKNLQPGESTAIAIGGGGFFEIVRPGDSEEVDTDVYDEMRARVSKGLDPLTGRPMETVGMIRRVGGTCRDATGRTVMLSEYGDWVYA